ncbi:MAG: pyridoxal phosphate-dependent decarboxylase family protein [Flammeovirgaceae bacterium]
MSKLIQDIEQLAIIANQLEPTPRTRNQQLEQLQQFANQFISSIPQSKAYFGGNSAPEQFVIDEQPKSLESLLNTYKSQVAQKGINAASSGHLGYIPGGSLFTAALGDFIVDISNEYAGMYYGSPGAVAMEEAVLNWMKSVFQFPKSAIGNLTSGGSIANLIALTAARDHHGIKGDLIEKSVVYLSEQTHHCIHKAFRIIGLSDIQIRHVPINDRFKIIPEKLNAKIEQDRNDGLNPFLVIASAGTTDTGAVDPLQAIGAIAHKNQLWYHIDAAYGGFFMLVDSKKHLFEGIDTADSLVIDPHKSLFLPFGIGAVLVKDRQAVFQSNHYRPNYMQDAFSDDVLINPADVSPELSKHFRGMRIWLPLQFHGLAPFKACLEEKLLLTQYFREKLIAAGFSVGPEPDLSVSYFWYPSKTIDQNAFNQSLLNYIHQDGRVFMSSTIIQGQFVIRMALLAFRTKLETIEVAMKMILAAKKKVENDFK